MAFFPRGYPRGRRAQRRVLGRLVPPPLSMFIGSGVTDTTSITYSTLTSSAASFVAGGAGVTLTFTAKDANDEVVPGYTPQPEAGVV